MFRIEEEHFGNFTKIRLSDTQTRDYISIIPECGANVNEIVLSRFKSSYSIIDGCQDSSELIENNWFKGVKLLPFPNRIAEGKYSFDGKTYQLPINFPNENHAIHGFLYDRHFRVTNKATRKEQASVTLEYLYQGDTKGYPFHFWVLVEYSLLRNTGFRCSTSIKNLDTRQIPIGDGWHPYFWIKGKVDNLQLRLPSIYKIEVDNRMIPNGEVSSFNDYSSLSKIGKAELDECLMVRETEAIATTELYDPQGHLKIILWQETGKMKYNFLQVFIPPSRMSIAIEPMTCATNAFNNKKGLIILKPEESFRASYGVQLK